MRMKLLTALLLLTLLGSSTVFSWNKVQTDFSKLNVDMRELWTGGQWQRQGKSGFIRLLVVGGGYEHYKTKLYIQWLLQGDDQQAPKILVTRPVKELNDNPVYAFNLPRCIDKPKCSRFSLVTEHTYTSARKRFILKLQTMGRYVLINTKN